MSSLEKNVGHRGVFRDPPARHPALDCESEGVFVLIEAVQLKSPLKLSAISICLRLTPLAGNLMKSAGGGGQGQRESQSNILDGSYLSIDGLGCI